MDRPLKTKWTGLWLCLAALLGCALIFPETFLLGKSSFFSWSDYLVDYQSTFALTGFFYQGGIQLWDFFGQMPHVFFWLTHGMFRLPNVLTAAVYILLSPFTDNSAQFFNQVFAIVYIGSLLCIRTIGIFLLLKRLTDDKWVLRTAPVIFALLFCPTAFLFGTFYQSYYPLWMYFILSFFLTWRMRYFGMSILFMLLSFSQGIIHTCYMYLGINFFIISCAVYSLSVNRAKLGQWREFLKKNARNIQIGSLGLLAVAGIILGPYIYMQAFWLKDVLFGADHSRLSGMWSAAHYFHDLKLDQSQPADFFRRMLDFTFLSGRSFFLGYMMFFLSGVALTMSGDRRKWIFVISILLVWSINFPRDTISIGLIGHWVNVLTNPLKVMVRSYQTAINSIISYLLMPLAVMGWLVLKDLSRGGVYQTRRLGWFAVFLIILAVNGYSFQPPIVRTYFTTALIISLTALALLIFVQKNTLARNMAKTLFIALILTDMAVSAGLMKHYIAANFSLRPHFVEDLQPQSGVVGIDFHNPKIYPFVGRSDMYPVADGSYLWTLRDMSLNINGVVNRETAFLPVDNYNPRHSSFGSWPEDQVMKDYISQNNKLFYFTGYAVQDGPGIFESIVRRKLAQDVMMVQGYGPAIRREMPSRVVPAAIGNDQWASIPMNISDGWPGWVYRNNMMIWDFPLQGSLPAYYATNIFTHDRWVRFFIQTPDNRIVELSPAQGQLLRPMTFDVQNIKEGKVFVALPADTSFVGYNGMLLFKTRDASGITSVWLHHSDETGIDFQAPADGWLGIQYPYDSKWRIDVDGKPAHFYRADKSFIGLPITRGGHKILIRYWPDSWLRWGLPLSVFLTSALFIVLIIYSLYEFSYE